ncbi:NifX-associated nitrogen fixation protein [Skermanella sp. TT6]|uniref:NifX-associated nitrogen fixation protein n=1 Tax=Skermanella cutis TaxID=2775420 RepID=A0ABX7BAF2_9PROT|nr:NifX-associated nitrogen fixation protein [Skermanella sp. TT6]QQP91375.1 NifX-associated nitrogen fixation protein [Skermanella sp. TT6]
MSETIEAPVVDQEFLKTLVSLIRAEDTYGAWEGKSDDVLLRPFILTKEERRLIPIIGDPDPDTITRVEQFYKAIGLTIEKRTRLMATPIMKMSHEGFGRMVLLTGRLVVLSKHIRDVHRFGFPSVEAVAQDGAKLVDEAVALIEKHRDVAEL